MNDESLQDLYDAIESTGLIRRLFELARDEDLGKDGHPGDVTSIAFDVPDHTIRAHVRARDAGTLAGLACVPTMIDVFAPRTLLQKTLDDGSLFGPGDTLATLVGPAREVVEIERTLLNTLSRLSGVATLTARYVEAVGSGTRAHVYDTRKTTPGLRVLEKYAVRCGGGRSHRLGLHDAVLVKDNHIASVAPDSLAERLRAARARVTSPLQFVQVEVDSLPQLDALLALDAGVIDIVLLDNMTMDQLREAVARRDAHQPCLLLECSGGVRLDTIRDIARTGVDRISVGALTHQAVSLDIGLDVGIDGE
ncbi:MAG: carboxylating nicotinate-nucleotide diphosphorylase [Planctomycetota bacterium]